MADTPDSQQGIPVETEALGAMKFYLENYDHLEFRGLSGNKQVILGTKPHKCRFCSGEPPKKTFGKRAHAVSELLGNKVLKSLYECDDCNERFSDFEDDLSKMTLPYRNAGAVIGKKGKGIPTLVSSTGQTRMEYRDGMPHISSNAGDKAYVVDEVAKTITFTYREQPYRPLGAYKALCKSAFSLLPDTELVHFPELRQWLLEKDVETKRVYSEGNNLLQSFVPALRPFGQPVVALLKRKNPIMAPYMTMFLAFGNISYQIFLPCPEQDKHLVGAQSRSSAILTCISFSHGGRTATSAMAIETLVLPSAPSPRTGSWDGRSKIARKSRHQSPVLPCET
jgi:hypothetical protein